IVFLLIVTPQTFGTKSVGGSIANGVLGSRSQRGTMVVDSMILQNGTFTISNADPSAPLAGNQAYLPLRILSKGPIRLENGATLNADGQTAANNRGGAGGPGGGGGEGGALSSGGDGYRRGGGLGDQTNTKARTGGDGNGA